MFTEAGGADHGAPLTCVLVILSSQLESRGYSFSYSTAINIVESTAQGEVGETSKPTPLKLRCTYTTCDYRHVTLDGNLVKWLRRVT
jgi:hypothetical protein